MLRLVLLRPRSSEFKELEIVRGKIPGRPLDGAELTIERTRYLAFDGGQTWRAMRTFSA